MHWSWAWNLPATISGRENLFIIREMEQTAEARRRGVFGVVIPRSEATRNPFQLRNLCEQSLRIIGTKGIPLPLCGIGITRDCLVQAENRELNLRQFFYERTIEFHCIQ